MPYHVAHGLAFTMKQGYRQIRRATGLTTRPLLSRQAVQVLGKNQGLAARCCRFAPLFCATRLAALPGRLRPSWAWRSLGDELAGVMDAAAGYRLLSARGDVLVEPQRVAPGISEVDERDHSGQRCHG